MTDKLNETTIMPKKCPECGTSVTDELPGGLCPACLMAVARKSQPGATAAMPSDTDLPTLARMAELFPGYEIMELIGRGGMGAVFKARQKSLDRMVALKLFLYRPDDPEFATRFQREARALARLDHPNIVTVHDTGRVEELHYMIMEFIDGLNLRQMTHQNKLEPNEAMGLVPQLCEALQFAHDNGIIHRDIKPENILVDKSGKIKIADFGLAKMTGNTGNDPTLTRTRQVMGTLNYMAPEQRERPTEVDHRADIYSLGVVIYEMLTGELPLGVFQPPSKKVEVDIRIDEIVMRALEKEPELRYQQVSEFKTGLESVGELTSRPEYRPAVRQPVAPVKSGNYTGKQVPIGPAGNVVPPGKAPPRSGAPVAGAMNPHAHPQFQRSRLTFGNFVMLFYRAFAMFLLFVACLLVFLLRGDAPGAIDDDDSRMAGIICAILGAFLLFITKFIRRLIFAGPAELNEKTIEEYRNMTWIGSALRIFGLLLFTCTGLLFAIKGYTHDGREMTMAAIICAIIGGAVMVFASSVEKTFFRPQEK